jgi:hypothetical protein
VTKRPHFTELTEEKMIELLMVADPNMQVFNGVVTLHVSAIEVVLRAMLEGQERGFVQRIRKGESANVH